MLELLYSRQLRATAFVPVASIGVGVYHLHATGNPAPPYEGSSEEVWAALADFGIGAGFRLTDSLMVLADAHALFAQPRPVIALGGEELGSAGRPSVYGSLGLTVRF